MFKDVTDGVSEIVYDVTSKRLRGDVPCNTPLDLVQ